MPAPQFTSQFFKARQIARAAGVDPGTVRRKAQREKWPLKQNGNRVAYRAPREWMRKRASVIAPCRSLLVILNHAETIRALDRAAAVNGFIREMQRDPKCGIEQALARTVSRFQHLMPFSVRVLRRWVDSVARSGLGALHENKIGRVGRRPSALHKVLK